MNKLLHPIKSLEQWALQRLLKRIAEELPVAKQQLAQLWEQHKDEIAKKVTDAVKDTIKTIIERAVKKQDNKVVNIAKN